MHDDSDVGLVERMQAGDEAAFTELITRYKKPILNFVYRMLGDAQDAEDVAQDVFVRAYSNLPSFRPKKNAKFSTWLFQLARNAAIDRVRYRRRHPTEPLNASLLNRGTTDRAVELNELEKQISAAIAELPEKQRTALVLAEYEDLSYAEIAEIMKISVKAVELHIYRAKKTLRIELFK